LRLAPDLAPGDEPVQRRRRWIGRRTPLYAAAPWLWFVVRDASPAFDAAAVALPIVVVGAVVGLVAVAVASRRRPPATVALSVLVFGVVATVGPWLPHTGPHPTGPFRVVAVNILGANPTPGRVAGDVLGANGDVVVVSEITPAVDERLDPAYRWSRRFDPPSDVAVYSRYPLHPLPDPDGTLARFRGGRLRVDTPDGPVVLYALHGPRPWPHTATRIDVTVTAQRRLVNAVLRQVRHERAPVIVAGDLNVVDRTGSYRGLTATLDDAMRSGWGGFTSLKWKPFLARIDHVLVSPSWCSTGARHLSLSGSDHRGIAVTVGPCPYHPRGSRR
jgi:endonuclease/exonuclease/phosphatase (EEP) superfamily protein YafD